MDGIGPTWREGAPTPCAFPVLAKHAQLTARERAPHPLLERVDVVVPGIALAACASQITLGFYGLGDRLRKLRNRTSAEFCGFVACPQSAIQSVRRQWRSVRFPDTGLVRRHLRFPRQVFKGYRLMTEQASQ